MRRSGWNTALSSTPDRSRCGLFLSTIRHMWRGGRAKGKAPDSRFLSDRGGSWKSPFVGFQSVMMNNPFS